MRRARTLILRLAAAAAVLAAATAAIALPAEDAGGRPQAVLSNATAALAHSNSRDGEAILTAANLKPGEERTGEVTITNRGHRGTLYLVAHDPEDASAHLSERLRLTIAEVSGPSPRVLSSDGLPAGTSCQPLGEFDPDESRTYRFTVAFADGGRGGTDNAYAGASTTVEYEWLETAVARDVCPSRSEDVAEAPDPPLPPVETRQQAPGPEPEEAQSGAVLTGGQVAVTLGDMQLAIVPGPYRFSGRGGTAKVGIRCIKSDTGACTGRLELERWKGGQGKGIAMAVGSFRIRAGDRKRITLKLNARARKRIAAQGLVAVRAYVTASDARGNKHRVAYKDRLLYRAATRARSGRR